MTYANGKDKGVVPGVIRGKQWLIDAAVFFLYLGKKFLVSMA
jgi:hypothetical protein